MPVRAGAEVVLAPEGSAPLDHAAGAVGRHLLVNCQPDDAARRDGCRGRRDREKRAVKVFEVAEQRRLEIALVGQLNAHAAAHRLPARVVDLADFAVAAIFREIAAAHERPHAVGRAVVQFRVHVAELHGRVVVDEAGLARRHNRKAVRVEHAAVGRDADLAPDIAAEQVDLRAVVVAVLRLEFNRPPRRPVADDVDDAAHRVVPVEARTRSIYDFDPVGALERHARPVHPAAERVVERDVVHQHQRAADAARADAAQRDALRRRMRRQAAGAPEQAERRNLPQHIVGHNRRRVLDVVRAEDVHACGNVAEPLLRLRRGDGHLFEQCRGHERDGQVGPARRGERLLVDGEAARADDKRHAARGRRLDGEVPVRTGNSELFAGRGAGGDGGAGDDGAGRVLDDAGHIAGSAASKGGDEGKYSDHHGAGLYCRPQL